jgi:hypothetical protein
MNDQRLLARVLRRRGRLAKVRHEGNVAYLPPPRKKKTAYERALLDWRVAIATGGHYHDPASYVGLIPSPNDEAFYTSYYPDIQE